jgi:outer membrane protein OmpA-like peptidoglycan-associated protein
MVVKPSTITEIASLLGISDQAAARGLALSTAAAFAGLARKADDIDTLDTVIDVASRTRPDAVVTAVSAGDLADTSSPLLSESRRLLATIFAGRQYRILDAISGESGLTTAAASALMPLGMQALLTFFGARVREEGMTPATLANFLKREAPELRRAMPPALDEAIMHMAPGTYQAIETAPVAAQAAVRPHRSAIPWLMACAAAILCAFWLFSRPDSVTIGALDTRADRPVGTSGHMPTIPTGPIPLPDNALTPAPSITFDLDQVLFKTGSAALRPQSMHQLNEAAAILKAHPDVHATISGFTDNVGAEEQNLKLSQERATNVMKALEGMGVPSDRLEATGFGEEQPIADNSTPSGRALNRRTSMEVTK